MFRQLTKMEKSFFHLISLIEGHPIFQNNSWCPQASMKTQLAVTLDRLGHNGNGACLAHMMPTWGISNGFVVNFCQCCFIALESILARVFTWPSSDERASISTKFAKHWFPDCVGLIDGLLLPLSQCPRDDGECYYNQKSRYSMNA